MGMVRSQLGGPLPGLDEIGGAIREVQDIVREVRQGIKTALDVVPRAEKNLDTAVTYMPWLIGAIGFLGVAIIIYTVKAAKK